MLDFKINKNFNITMCLHTTQLTKLTAETVFERENK